MWHASISRGSEADRRLMALRVLDGIGDAPAGEWWEASPIATHCRRRLSPVEALRVGDVVDVRHTAEAARRFRAMRPYFVTPVMAAFAERELVEG